MAQKMSDLAIGALVKDTQTLYYGKPIIWRIADKEHSGYPSRAVTLITDKIISIKCFDAMESTSKDSDRRSYGNNRYVQSNIRSWLNSAATAGKWYSAQHSTDAPPTNANVWSSYNDYDQEAGFLAGFSMDMRAALLSTMHTVGRSSADGGGSETCVDKIFLASCTEVGLSGDVVCGSELALFSSNASRKAYPTAECVSKSEYQSSGLSTTQYRPWWLCDAYASKSSKVYNVYSSGRIVWSDAVDGVWGVRPLCNIQSSILVSDTMDSDGCYTMIFNDKPPTTPIAINVPENINGGSTITVSWSSSTDAEGNLAGYKVERSTDGGNTWLQIYQSTGTSCSDNIIRGWTSVRYRVKAYDTVGNESDWKVSVQRYVFNNTAPTTPSNISVPMIVTGGSKIIISWSSSTDAEGNLAGYKVERSLNGGSTWTQVYQGTSLTYQDTIVKGWVSVRYRVKAYDAVGAESNYTTSSIRTVDNSTAPTITYNAGENLGTKTEGFSVPYTVDDVDGDVVTVTEALDGETKRTYTATLGASNSFDITGEYFMCILNGSHTLTITATDAGGKGTTISLTFKKAVYRLRIRNTEPMDVNSNISKMVMTIYRSIPADAVFNVLVTNNAKDATPVWENATNSIKNGLVYLFNNATAENGFAFAFDITAERAPNGNGGYISSIGGAYE